MHRRYHRERRKREAAVAAALLVSLLACFEDAVGNEELPLYHRGYAWFKLLWHWSSTRWDDTQGLVPLSLER